MKRFLGFMGTAIGVGLLLASMLAVVLLVKALIMALMG